MYEYWGQEYDIHDDGRNKGSYSCLYESGGDVLEPTNVLDVLSFRSRELFREIWKGREIKTVGSVDLDVEVTM